jgi:hypothetical protein
MPKQILACKDLNIATNVIILETKQNDFFVSMQEFSNHFLFSLATRSLTSRTKKVPFCAKENSVKCEIRKSYPT